MNIGFVYILLNPAFPDWIKIGRTACDPKKRAGELSRQTGVPDDFIVLYDEIVSNAKEVEELLHSKFKAYRTKKKKEFFHIPPKDAIKALQEIASRFPISESTTTLSVDLMPHFSRYFGSYLDRDVVAIKFIQLPGLCYLEVARQRGKGEVIIINQEEIPLAGLETPEEPTLDSLRANEAHLKSCDAYDWIMISDLFPEEIAIKIAREWEKPGGKLEQVRRKHNEEF